ncbi:putative translation-initiation factor 2 [Lyophyllum shimeji]|uniref:Translation initiation factor IF-2, mitochondrial n=1 Tax=Lyophyllum shimeji TaxID=47721 RepID=A0A9P3PGM0_LYOSH|nr:putative translation-initiation factor 2 [Lyophyllum shimeji]
MHRHRKVWPIVRASCAPSRSAATAAKTKPRPADDSISRPATLGKWALPPLSPSAPFSGSTAFAGTSSSGSKPSGVAKWALPPARGTGAIPKSTAPSPQPGLASTRWSPLSATNTPNKWARSAAQSQPQNTRPPRTESRLQRDLAPHQDPAAHRSYKSPSSSERSNPRQSQSHRSTPIAGSSNLRSASDSSSSTPQSIPRFKARESWEGSPTLKNTDANRTNAQKARPERPSRATFKERGSLLSTVRQDEPPPTSIQNRDVKKVKKNVVVEKKVSADVYIPSTVSVGALARLLGVRLEQLQHKMRLAGMAEEAEYDHVLTSDYAVLLAEEFGRNPIVNDEAAFDIFPPPPHPDPSSLKGRPPVVTIMGHVDHGKTTLLDTLRASSVAKGEAGGITQHIGAFSVPVPASAGNAAGPQSITFLDTPGHAAFSAMRARGARVTDIVVLVVAADDGIMPQTKEVINLIKKDEGKIGVVVAINKVDKPGIDVETVQKALLAENIQLEVFGGDIPSVEVSGLTGHGLPTLVETISAIAEMQDLRAERDGPVQGYVLESKVHKGLGPVATVLVLRGCLKPGSHIISGLSHAKVRVMNDSTGVSVKAAYPGMAITVSGWKTLPDAGDEVLQGTEAEVKKALANRQRKAEIEATLVDVEAINASRRQERERRELALELGEAATKTSVQDSEQGPKELRLIIKADVSGSAEAVQGALQGIGNKEAITRIVSSGVGEINESDVMKAKAVGATIVGFSVSTPRAIETLAAQNDVPIISSDVIYRLMEIVKDRVIALLPVIIETRVTGEAAVLQLFDIQLKAKQTKKVAGCRVTNGIIEKSKYARLVRNGNVVHEGMLDTMRILKKDVTEVRKGSECGLCFGAAFADLQEGDIIQVYEKIEKPGVL